MKKFLILSSLAAAPALAHAQPSAAVQSVPGGVRLEVVGTGEVTRTPDQVTIGAGVVTRAPQAEAAMRENAERMVRVRAALARAGIAERDIQTGQISLSQDYRPDPAGQEMRPAGYVANNSLSIRFRDVARAGPIIDALVAEGVNNIHGPSFGLADNEAARDEARMRAVADARARAELYARSLNSRVRRIVSISEAAQPGVFAGRVEMQAMSADTIITPGELAVTSNVTVTFELDQPGG